MQKNLLEQFSSQKRATVSDTLTQKGRSLRSEHFIRFSEQERIRFAMSKKFYTLVLCLAVTLCVASSPSEAALARLLPLPPIPKTIANLSCGISKFIFGNGTITKWVCRVDPLNVEAFHLDFAFDPTRLQFESFIIDSPFTQVGTPDLSQASSGLLQDIAGETLSPMNGDVFMYDVTLVDLHPELNTIPVFTPFASSNDSITVIDTDTGNLTVVGPADILPCPEPSTYAFLAAFTLMGAVFLKRRKRTRRIA